MRDYPMKQLHFSLAVLVVLVGSTPLQAVGSADTLRFASGMKGGNYYIIAQNIRSIMGEEHPDLIIKAFETHGSEENVRLLLSGKADIALSESHIVYYFSSLRKDYPLFKTKINGIAALYHDALHIVTRSDLNMDDIFDLAGHRITIGPTNSATGYLARLILQETGLIDHVEWTETTFMGSANSLKKGDLDASFFSAGYPIPVVSGLMKKGLFRLIGFRPSLLGSLVDHYPELMIVSIPPRTYENQPEAVPTVGINTLLIARRDVNPAIISSILKSIDGNRDRFSIPIDEAIFQDDESFSRLLPVHPGAEPFFISLSPLRKYSYILDLAPFFAIIILLVVFEKITLKPEYAEMQYINILRGIGFILLFWIVGAIAMNHFERDINKNFSTISESIWSIGIYFFSGFEDKYPTTTMGKTISILLLLSWIGVIAFFTAEFAAIFSVKKIQKKERRVKMVDHYLFCNWNSRGEKIVGELHNENSPAKNSPILILTDRIIDDKMYHRLPEFSKNVQFHAGNLFKKEILKDLSAHDAKAIIVLKDEEAEDPDGKSAQIVLVLQSLMKEVWKSESSKWPVVVVEVHNHRKISLIKDAYGEGTVEPICAGDYAAGLLAQTAIFSKMASVYNDLLDYSDETNEIYMLEWESLSEEVKSLIRGGIDFEDLAIQIYGKSDGNKPVILLGYKRGGDLFVNPTRERARFLEGDSLIVMAYERPGKPITKQG